MKKIIAIILALTLCLSLAACGDKTPAPTEAPKDYILDKDKLEELLFDVTVESDRDAFGGVYAVTDETYNALVGDIVSKDLINDYIVFFSEDQWASKIFFAFQTDKVSEVTAAMNDFFATYKEEKWISDDEILVCAESGWNVWSVSGDNKAVLEVIKRGMEKDVMQAELLAIKASDPVFAANMPSRLEDDFYVLEGQLDKENLVDMYILNSTIIGVNPLMIFKPAEGCETAVEEFAAAWKAAQLDTMSWYQPHLVPIIESMELVEENGYMIYIISEYPDVIKEAIADSWAEVK